LYHQTLIQEEKMQKIFVSFFVVLCLALANPCLSDAAEKKKDVAVGQLVNINTATAKELEVLPGIGNVIATEIVQYRTEGHKFNTPEDLLKVKGVGDKTFEKIRGMIVVK